MAAQSTRRKVAATQDTAGKPEASPGNSARRQEVIDAAAAIFAQHGYHGIGTRALADELGIKVASLYFHVRSKDHALEEVCQRGIDQPLKFLKSTLQQPPGLAGRIRHYFAQVHKQLVNEADYITVVMNEAQHLSPDARKRVECKNRELRRGFDRMFEEARAAGELHPDLTPRSASFIMAGTIRNLSQLYVDGPIRGFDDFVKDAVEALIRAVTKP